MMDSQCLPVTTLEGMFYFSPLTLYLLPQSDVADRQRLLRLQSELSRHCGSFVELHSDIEAGILEPFDKQQYIDSGGKVTWDYWEVSASPFYQDNTIVELHSRPVRLDAGMIDVSAQEFLEHLVQTKTIDWAIFRQRPLSSKELMASDSYFYIAVGSRAAHYVCYMMEMNLGSSVLNFVWRLLSGKYFWKIAAAFLGLTPMSKWEIYKFVSANIDNSIKVLNTRDTRALVKAVNKELRAKLRRKEFIRLMAFFA